MTQPESSTPDYTIGFSDAILEAFRRNTAYTSAAFLLPYLRPGMRVLDFGCGPGTVSVGLAKAVEPGELHGIDMEESQIEAAKSVAEFQRQPNTHFQVADVANLPYEDGYFDVAYCHQVLMHIPDTAEALAEVKRVLKPGGIIACREMITQASFTQPDYGVINRAWDMYEDLLAAGDGHPQMGKELKKHLVLAGFENIKLGGSFDTYYTPEDLIFIYNVAHSWFLSPEIMEAAILYGASSKELGQAVGVAYERWKNDPGAMSSIAFGESIANKP